MLHSLRSSGAATIDEVRVSPGDQVGTDDILVTFATVESGTDSDPQEPSQETPR